MADYANRNTEDQRRRETGSDYGRSAFREGEQAHEAYGRDLSQEHVGSGSRLRVQDYVPDIHWNAMLDARAVSTLAVGAGLGLLAGVLVVGSRQPTQGRRQRNRSGNRNRRFSSVPVDETDELIASNKVEGTAVYDRKGKKLGEIYNFMVGKRSGRVAYAVMSFGGLLGIGSQHYPLPWSALDYDPERGGYVVDLDKDQLNGAPSHAADQNGFADPGYARRVSEFWLVTGAPPTVF